MLPTANPDLAVCLTLTRAISRAESVEEIYGIALDALKQGLGVARAAILLYDADGVMRFKAFRGLSDTYRTAVEGHSPWQPDNPDAEPIVVPDVSLEPSLAAYLPVIAEEGIAAMAFIPMVSLGRVIGKFMLYYPTPRTFGAEEIQLATLVAAQVVFAVERTRAADALERSSRAAHQLAAIVQSSGDAIVSKDLNGTIMSWNRAAERMFGYSAAEAVGQSITLIIPQDRRSEEDLVLAHVRAGEPIEMETIRRRKDGTLIPISLMVSPVKDETGRIIGASKTARDITARKQDEAERAELHRRLTTLVAASASLLSAPETEPVLAATISIAQQLLIADGYAVWATDRNDQAWRTLSSAGVSEAFASRAITSDRGGGAAALQFSEPLAIPDIFAQPLVEEQRDAYVREGIRSILVCPMRLGAARHGTLVFYYRSPQYFSDMDKETGHALANLAAAAITTADLYEELQTKRHAAEVASRLKDEFLATLSHELRTPLNAILGYAQMLSMGVLSQERRSNALTVLTRNAEALKQMIGDVLDVARITSGKLRLNVRPVELGEIAGSAVATVQPAADAKGVSVQIDVDPRTPLIAGDPDRLQQIVWNLLSNAVKFTPRGGHVRVQVAAGHSSVDIVVTDDGQGIDPGFLPHIFERFRQADARFSREHGGLGLGLAIVRELAELHGGTVSAVSAGPGTGATFTVRLAPMGASMGQQPAESPPGSQPHAAAAQQMTERLTGLRILAVDNEQDALELLRLSLESAGAVVTTAASSEEALDLLGTQRFDVLVADIGMPRIDGLELIRRIRRTLPPPANELPAAALTAYARPEDRLAALSSGFQMHLAKPLNPVDLVMAVGTLAGR